MNDLIPCEDLIPIAKARRLFPSNPTIRTLYQWERVGLKAPSGKYVKLKIIRDCTHVYLTKEEAERFRRAVNGN